MTTRSWLLISGACLLTGAAAGRYTARTPDVTHQEAARETIAESTTQEVASETTAHVEAQEATERIVYRDRVVYRDGPVAEVTREVEGSRSQVATVADTRVAEVRVEVREVEVVREVERRIEVRTPLPDWMAGPMVGVDAGLRPVYGGMGAYRVLGPFHLGAWVTIAGVEPQGGVLLVGAW